MTDSRQELQTLAASALMVGLHQAIEAYHEAVRGAKAGEHSRVSANAPCSRRWRRTASASWPSRSVCSGSSCTIATRGVVSADAKRPARRRRGVSSAQRRTPTRSLHANATWAMAVTTGAPSSESLPAPSPPPGSYTQEHRGPTAVSSDVTVPVGSKSLTRQLPPIHRRRVRAWFAHACQHAALPTAPNISPNAQYCRIGGGNLRPPCRNLRLLAPQIYAWWLMVFPGTKRRVNHGVA